jgi:hypothetical protein
MRKVWVLEGYQLVHSKIAMTQPMLKQHHSELLKTRPKNGVYVPKEIFQRSNVPERFYIYYIILGKNLIILD